MYVSLNKQLANFKVVSAVCLGFARERVKSLIISNVGAGNKTLCCEQGVAQILRVERAWIRGLTLHPFIRLHVVAYVSM